jgi:hypothetical protein
MVCADYFATTRANSPTTERNCALTSSYPTSLARVCSQKGSGWLQSSQQMFAQPWSAQTRMFSAISGPPSSRAASRTKVERSEILPMTEYEKLRKEFSSKYRTPAKRLRRIALGPRSALSSAQTAACSMYAYLYIFGS